MAAVIKSSNDAVISKDFNGIITSRNKSAQKPFGCAAEEVIVKSDDITGTTFWSKPPAVTRTK